MFFEDYPPAGDDPPEFPICVPLARPVGADAIDLGFDPAYARRAPRDLPWWRALLESVVPLVAALLGAFAAAPLLMFWRPADHRWTMIAMTSVGGLAAMLACGVLLRLEGQRANTIGWTARAWLTNAAIGVGSYLASMVALAVLAIVATMLFPAIRERQNDAAQAIRETFPVMSLANMVVFMCFVATWEEIAFRGFMLTRLRAAFKRWWAALPVGAVLFGLGHLYEGPLACLQTMLLGIILGLLFWWRKSLIPGIVFHILNNLVAFLVLNGS